MNLDFLRFSEMPSHTICDEHESCDGFSPACSQGVSFPLNGLAGLYCYCGDLKTKTHYQLELLIKYTIGAPQRLIPPAQCATWLSDDHTT